MNGEKNKREVRSQKYQFKFCEILIKSDEYFNFQKSNIDDIGITVLNDKILGKKEQISIRVDFVINSIGLKLDDYVVDNKLVMSKAILDQITQAIQKDKVIQTLMKQLNALKTRLEDRYEILQLK